MLASGVNYVKNQIEKEKAASLKPVSQWIGSVGGKVSFKNVRLVDMKSGLGQFGSWYLWSFETVNGNQLKKFGELNNKFLVSKGSGKELQDYNEGDIFSFTAEIKKHDEYKGTKNTMLGRLSKA
jgi:hypothetical protein